MFVISFYKGVCPIAFPKEWVDAKDPDFELFHNPNTNESAIRFANGRTFILWVEDEDDRLVGHARRVDELPEEFVEGCPHVEPWAVAELMGCATPIDLSDLDIGEIATN